MHLHYRNISQFSCIIISNIACSVARLLGSYEQWTSVQSWCASGTSAGWWHFGRSIWDLYHTQRGKLSAMCVHNSWQICS